MKESPIRKSQHELAMAYMAHLDREIAKNRSSVNLNTVAAELITQLDSISAATWGGVFVRYDTQREIIATDLRCAGLVEVFEILPNGMKIRWKEA